MPSVIALNSAASGPGEMRGDVLITPLNPVDGSPILGETFVLQFFPEEISDAKGVSWANKEISGGSLPIYSWQNSGERTISFTAYFSSDVDFLAKGDANKWVIHDRVKEAGVQRMNVDVRSALANLRSYLLPTYVTSSGSNSVPMTQAPRRLRLFIPGSGIGVTGGLVGGQETSPDSIMCFMSECGISYKAFFPSGLPRLAEVSLGFTQVCQVGSTVQFPQSYAPGDITSFLPYVLSARRKGGY